MDIDGIIGSVADGSATNHDQGLNTFPHKAGMSESPRVKKTVKMAAGSNQPTPSTRKLKLMNIGQSFRMNSLKFGMSFREPKLQQTTLIDTDDILGATKE